MRFLLLAWPPCLPLPVLPLMPSRKLRVERARLPVRA
jgi:hypothetical protein